MKLPKVPETRLQRVVGDVEYDQKFKNFSGLCDAVADTDWAKGLGLTSIVIGALIVHHDIATKIDKPDSVELPEEPKAAKPAKAEKPAKASKTDEPAIRTYDGPGPKRKQCPACSKYVGYSLPTCACGHEFSKDEPEDEDVPPTIQSMAKPKKSDPPVAVAPTPIQRRGKHLTASSGDLKGNIKKTYTPAGDCPHRLTGTDVKTVEAWAENCRGTFLEKGDWLLVPALKYFSREFHSIHSPDYRAVCDALDQLYGAGMSPEELED